MISSSARAGRYTAHDGRQIRAVADFTKTPFALSVCSRSKIKSGSATLQNGRVFLNIDDLGWFEECYLSLRLRIKYGLSLKGGLMRLEGVRYVRGPVTLKMSADQCGDDLCLYSESDEGDQFLSDFARDL